MLYHFLKNIWFLKVILYKKCVGDTPSFKILSEEAKMSWKNRCGIIHKPTCCQFFLNTIYLANFFMTLDFSNSRGFYRSCKFSLMNVLQNCWFQRSCRWKKYKYYKNICHFIRRLSCNNFYTNYIELVSQKVTCKSNKTFV